MDLEPSTRLKFSLNEPTELQEFTSGEVLVRGWAIASDREVSITVRVGDNAWVEIPHGRARTDVARAYSTEPNAIHSGFSGSIPASPLEPGLYDFTLHIRAGSDELIEVMRTIRIGYFSRSAREVSSSPSNEIMRMKLDEPSENSIVLRGSVLRVSGWAAAASAIAQVQIWLDGAGPQSAHYGLIREDIDLLSQGLKGATHVGFLWAGNTGHLEPGSHHLRVLSKSNAGNCATINANFQVDQKSDYEYWSNLNRLSGDRRIELFEKSESFSYAPTISIITPVFQTDESLLAKCITSIKRQVYPRWEIILVDDCSSDSDLTALLAIVAADDRRIKVKALSSHLGYAGAASAGVAVCKGEYVAFLGEDDELSSDALFFVANELNQDPSLDVFYSDDDKVDEKGGHRDVFFKPDWSPDLLSSMNYACNFLVCRRSLLQEVGGIRPGFDGNEKFDLILRLSEHTSKICHIPKVLYHRRYYETSPVLRSGPIPDASTTGKRALEQHLTRKGVAAEVDVLGACRYRVRYKIQGEPEVAIIIPTGGSRTLDTILKSVLTSSTYRNLRIVVVDNSRQGVAETVAQYNGGRHPIALLDCRNLGFNFSLLCNKAVRATASKYLLFLNDDTSIITPNWIEAMLEHAQREMVGAVGSLLLFPNGTIQHAGVVTGLFEVAGHSFRGLSESSFYFDFQHVVRNCSAVTGACLMARRDIFEAVGGFDEINLPTCFQDVDLCLKMLDKGCRVVYTPFAKLYHHETISKVAAADASEVKFMRQRWASYISNDPYYNPNLTRSAEDYSLRYDNLFVDHHKGSNHLPLELRTSAARTLGGFGRPIRFYTSPSGTKIDEKGLSRTTVFWDVTGPEKIQIRVGNPMGTVLFEGNSSGSTTTGPWARSGLVLYLLDATESSAGSPDNVLSVLQV